MTHPTATTDARARATVGRGSSAAVAWLRLVVGSLCQCALAMLVFLALWAALPALVGWQPTTVSSGSMMPRLHVGDVAVAKPLDRAPVLGQVLLFRDPDHPGKLRLHRFVRVDDQGRMITRGDANPSEDSSPIAMDAVEGVALLRVPTIARPVVWMREGRWVAVGVTSAALVLLLAGSGLLQPHGGHPDQGSGGSTGASGSPLRGTRARRARLRGSATPRPQSRRPVVALVALITALGLASLVVARPAWAGYTSTTTNPSSSLSSASAYRCPSVVLPLNPTLYYRLDEASGSVANDSSGAGAHGTLQVGYSRSPSAVCSVPSRSAVTLNGDTGYLSTPTLFTAPNTFTTQVWFKTTTTRGGRLIGFGNLRTGSSGSADRHIYMSDTGQLVFGVQSGSNQRPTIASASGYNDGNWHLVTASLSLAGMRLYVDDTLVATRTATTAGIVYTGYWRVGYDNITSSWGNRPNSNYFQGTVAEAAVYPTALSNASVASVYNTGRP